MSGSADNTPNITAQAVIWAVDGDPERLQTLEAIVIEAGYEFRRFLALDALDAALATAAPDILLLDVAAPGMSGGEFLRDLRRRPDSNPVLVMVLTSPGSESSILNAFEAGADEVLRRPFSVPELLARINWLVRRNRRLTQLRQRSEDMMLMTELARALSSYEDSGHILGAMMDGVTEALEVDSCKVLLLDEHTGELRKAHPSGATFEEATEGDGLDLARLPELASRIAERQPAYLEAGQTGRILDALQEPARPGLESAAVFPMMLHDELVGAVVVFSSRPWCGRSARERRILSIVCDLGAVAVHRVSLYESIRQESRKIDEANRELAKTRDFLSNVIESSPDAIVAADADGEILLFNRAAVSVLGWNAEEAVGMSVRNLYPRGGAERIMSLLRAQEHGGVGRLESRREIVTDCAGGEIPVSISAAIVYDPQGAESATVGIFTDLRQRLDMEERLQEATENLERTRRKALLAELAGGAAHELNQPLTSLLGYAELLCERLDDHDEMRKPAEVILRDGRRIAEIVKKIGQITNYRTKEYVAGAKIVDLDQAIFEADAEFDPAEWGLEPESSDLSDGDETS